MRRSLSPSAAFSALFALVAGSFRSRAALQIEILALRHQLSVLQRSVKRPQLTATDHWLWAWLSQIWSAWRTALVIVKPETVIGWHRQRFVCSGLGSAGMVGPDDRASLWKSANSFVHEPGESLWGAPKIHGELLKLGFDLSETSVSKYLVRRPGPRSQSWKTFLENHLKSLVSVDFFTVPTIRFQLLYVFLVMAHDRRRILHFAVTQHPTAEWTAQQLREAFPWDIARHFSVARSRSNLRQ